MTNSNINTPLFPAFTDRQLTFLAGFIDERIALHAASTAAKRPAGKAKEYHTVHDIRDLIRQNLSEFRRWIAGETFHISLLRHFLATKTVMRSLDTALMTSGGHQGSISRFDQQVGNAIQNWPDSPFTRTGTAGHYKITHL